MGSMKVEKARERWADIRRAARSGDPAAMLDAVSRFEGIADTMLAYFTNRDRLRAENERLSELLDAAEQACEDRADRLDDMGLEVECCVATAKNCADDIRNLRETDNDPA